jgi:hypothetical protein
MGHEAVPVMDAESYKLSHQERAVNVVPILYSMCDGLHQKFSIKHHGAHFNNHCHSAHDIASDW